MEPIQLVDDIQNFALDIVDAVREPLLILDATLHVRSANRAFYQTFQVTPEETENRLIYDLGNRQWDIPTLRTLLKTGVPWNSEFDDFEVEHDFEHIGRKTMLLNASRFPREGDYKLLVLAMEDVTEHRRSEEALNAIETYAQNTSHTRKGAAILLAGVIGFVVWAAYAPLDEGVPTEGQISIEMVERLGRGS